VSHTIIFRFGPFLAQVIETICYSRQLDPWFVNKHKEDNEFWGAAGIEDPSFFFGSQDGIFRIFPGRHSKVCGAYDHRVRPWYNAASSGPKNIVMVLDTSGSMEGKLLDLLKFAARRVINTLSIGDKVSIVQFSTDARLHAGAQDRMLTATAENKKNLLDIIDRFEAIGGTNFYDAFVKAFDSLEATVVVELANDCNTAILFMTDGIMSGPVRIPEEDRPAAVLQLVGKRLGEMQQNHPIILFTYSVGDSGGDVHAFPKQLACSTEGGVWSKIVDETKLAESLASYSSLFSLGLGDNENENFTAWIEPYIYSTGGVTGTTISAPVYDRSRVPHLFIGVVGFDITISAIERLGNANAKEILSRLVDGSRAKCHSLEVTPCVLESFRRRGSAGDNALCFPGNCTESDFVQIEPEICSTLSDLPSNVFDNGNFSDKTSYEEKVCCLQGENERTTECPAPSTGTSSNITIIAVAVGVVAFVGLCFFIWFVKRRMAKEGYICRQHEGKKPEQIHEVSQEIAHGDVLAMPPPSRNPNARSSAPLASLDKP